MKVEKKKDLQLIEKKKGKEDKLGGPILKKRERERLVGPPGGEKKKQTDGD